MYAYIHYMNLMKIFASLSVLSNIHLNIKMKVLLHDTSL